MEYIQLITGSRKLFIMKNLFLFFAILGHTPWTGNIQAAEMKDLPSYVQAIIFNKLSHEDLLKMRGLNKKCKEIIDNKILFKRKLRVKIRKEKAIRSDLIREIAETLEVTTGIFGGINAKWIKDHFPANGKCWPSLKTLILKSNRIDDEGAKALAEFLISNSTVNSLDLSDNYMEGEGAYYLAIMLQKNKSLTSMNLYGNNFGDGIATLNKALKQNKKLIQLNLENQYLKVCVGSSMSGGMGGYVTEHFDNLDPRINSIRPNPDDNSCIIF